ncbi:helix-turn-helix transcriptional regulator [Ureibacillus terrenus]|uniref:helix-turn-helix transcriptional regulator n=1 Tax=Ureibacillus terrenus TaxID=118246 RepID=UPI002E1F0B87|nr:helix-turn-helix transcriptional regulator [Ureibacillus terrenus]
MDRHLIRRIRHIKGMSQLEFSQALGVSRGLIAQVEAGYIRPSEELKRKIRAYVGDDFIEKIQKILEE